VIRPLVYVGEDEARAYTKACELPIIGCCCPACGDLGLQRQRTKRLLMELEREHPGVKQSMLKALANVAPRHLLDTRLNPPGDLRVRLKPDPADSPREQTALTPHAGDQQESVGSGFSRTEAAGFPPSFASTRGGGSRTS
jgi:tRNA(Ile)-lysidine synthase TilS/MesJ